MEKIIVMFLLGIGITLIAQLIKKQIKCHIRYKILKNNVKKHDEKKKIKQQKS